MNKIDEITFINFNGIEQYARVMYNDVKDSDKYRIEVAYNGKDIKALLEYLFKLEEESNKQKEVLDKIKELTLQRKHCEDLFGGKEKTINDKILELLEE